MSQVILGKPSLLHQVALQTNLESPAAVDQNDDAIRTAPIEMVAPGDP
jgi:hypothetical protein